MKALWYKLLRLINPAPKEWLEKLEGNAAVDYEIYLEYLQHEGQEWRREDLARIIPFAICLEDDPNWQEVMEWWRYRVIQEFLKGRYEFKPGHVSPRCWYRDDRKYRQIASKEEIVKLNEEMRPYCPKMRVGYKKE